MRLLREFPISADPCLCVLPCIRFATRSRIAYIQLKKDDVSILHHEAIFRAGLGGRPLFFSRHLLFMISVSAGALPANDFSGPAPFADESASSPLSPRY